MSEHRTTSNSRGTIDLSMFEMDLTEFISLDKFRGKQKIFILDGIVEEGTMAQFSINGSDFSIGQETWIFGDFKIGSRARVEGTTNADTSQYARKIVVKEELPLKG